MEHPRQLDVRRVARLTAGPLETVDPLRWPSDGVERTFGPLVERVLLDHDPLLGVAALDLLLGADQPRHVEIASSIFG